MRYAGILVMAALLLACNGTAGGGPDGGGPSDLGHSIDFGDNICTAERACKSGICYAPGEFIGCGACRPPMNTCQKDADCKVMGANYICSADPRDCLCTSATLCHPGCTGPADCGTAEVCGTDNRCTGKPCAGPGDCPADFACTASRCQRKTCTGSAECGSDYCVKGSCYDTPGFCTFPPP